ncbi:GGDEF domain-containing protein [Vibrio gallaecicus]|uniref:GGDEF domain-containing protein n=1 Tax=Vibrio gallaecicus TaxID=552386 RepID=UPI0010CA0549|nr:diguanylate cyclase [Vibrio gallaecicus]MDN3616902.1 diguanylate cyclase [Vibrio gallaecicus]
MRFPKLSLRKVLAYFLIIGSVAPLIFASNSITKRIVQTDMQEKEKQISNIAGSIDSQLKEEFARIEHSLSWLSHDRFNIQAVDNILYSSVINQNLDRFRNFSNLINSVYIVNADWEPLYNFNGSDYQFEQSQLYSELKQQTDVYKKGQMFHSTFFEPKIAQHQKNKGSGSGVAIASPMLAYTLDRNKNYQALGYIILLIDFADIEHSFSHFLYEEEYFSISSSDRFGIVHPIESDKDNEAFNKPFHYSSTSLFKPLTLNLEYRFSNTYRLKAMNESRKTLSIIFGFTLIVSFTIALFFNRWIKKQFTLMEKTIVSYAKNEDPSGQKFQFTEFMNITMILRKMSTTIRRQLSELKNQNAQLAYSKKIIEESNHKLSMFNQELEDQVQTQTAQISEALFREEQHKNNLAAVIEFASQYSDIPYRLAPVKIKEQLTVLFPNTPFDLVLSSEIEHGLSLHSSKGEWLASLIYEETLELKEQNLVFRLFLKQLSAWLELLTIARKDGLLPCKNRKAFNEDFNTIDLSNIGLFIIDINGLKIINDNYGHDLGDALIQLCCNTIQQQLAPEDTLYRIGGDELAILTNHHTFAECSKLDARLSQSQEGLTLTDGKGKQHSAHFSIGWANNDKSAHDIQLNTSDLFKQADEMMYKNKQSFYNGDTKL